MFYSGIGPRDCGVAVRQVCTSIGRQLSPTGWILRSGNAIGVDSAFQAGATRKTIYLPFEGYNKGWSNHLDRAVRDICPKQVDIAWRHYDLNNKDGSKPPWLKLKETTKYLMLRNVPIILGENLDEPSEMVVTAIPEGYNGGTTHALSIAQEYEIPIFNILNPKDQQALCEFTWARENVSS